jgi:hypothetical protein
MKIIKFIQKLLKRKYSENGLMKLPIVVELAQSPFLLRVIKYFQTQQQNKLRFTNNSSIFSLGVGRVILIRPCVAAAVKMATVQQKT